MSRLELSLRPERIIIKELAAPLQLFLTFKNGTTAPVAIVTNRIELHNNLKLVFLSDSSNIPEEMPSWESIPSPIADYPHCDNERVLVLQPSETYTHTVSLASGLQWLRLLNRNGHLFAVFAGWNTEHGVPILSVTQEEESILWTNSVMSNVVRCGM